MSSYLYMYIKKTYQKEFMKYKRVIWRNILGKTKLKVDKTGCMVRVQCLPTMYQSYDVISNYSAKLEKHVLVYEAINWDPGVAG